VKRTGTRPFSLFGVGLIEAERLRFDILGVSRVWASGGVLAQLLSVLVAVVGQGFGSTY